MSKIMWKILCLITLLACASVVSAKPSQSYQPDKMLDLSPDEESPIDIDLQSNQFLIKKQPEPRGQFRTVEPGMPPDTITGTFTYKF